MFASNRDELTKLRTERDAFRDELAKANILSDWLRFQVNTLQMERTELMGKAYGIHIPAPMLQKASPQTATHSPMPDALFEDIGDDMAKRLGLPTYN